MEYALPIGNGQLGGMVYGGIRQDILQFNEKTLVTGSSTDYDRGAAVFLHWERDRMIIYLDTSGAPLCKRGYRKIPGSAPMQETLAAACIDALHWDRKTPFISPMECAYTSPSGAFKNASAILMRNPSNT